MTIALLMLALSVPAQEGVVQDPDSLVRARRWAEAEQAFQRLQEQRPLTPQELQRAVEVSKHLNNWSRVVQLLKSAGSPSSLPFPLRVELYQAHLRLGEQAAAETELRNLLEEQPGNEQLVHALAFLYLSQQRFPLAAQVYRRFLSRKPEAVESWINLALILFKLEQAEEALSSLHRAFQNNFQEANRYFYRQLVRNMPPDGLAQLAEDTKKELGLPQDGARAHLYLAQEFSNLFRYQNAIQEYLLYLKSAPEDWESRYALARLYFQAGAYDEAGAAVEQLLNVSGSVGEAARLLGAELAVRQNDLARASQLISDLPERFHHLPAYQYVSARVFLEQGDLARAEQLLKGAAEADPPLPEALFHLGQLYLRQGRIEEGRAVLAEFQRLKRP